MNEKLLKNAKPILFNTDRVKSIKDGRMTQFRVAIKMWKEICTECCERVDREYHDCTCGVSNPTKLVAIDNPKYNKGDMLYIRETFTLYGERILYKSDDTTSLGFMEIVGLKWKPSIHMPKKYARIFLKVTDVRVERLQDIRGGYKDILAEGLPSDKNYSSSPNISKKEMLEWFITLWNSTAKDGSKWEDNPYVFIYEFEENNDA